MPGPSSYSLDAILPHRTPMRFVDSVKRTGTSTVETTFTVPASGPWVSRGVLRRAALVEFAAQTAAALAGLERCELGLPQVAGYLAGADSFHFVTSVPAGARIVCSLELRFRIGSIARTACRVHFEDGTLVAEGDLALAAAESAEAALEGLS